MNEYKKNLRIWGSLEAKSVSEFPSKICAWIEVAQEEFDDGTSDILIRKSSNSKGVSYDGEEKKPTGDTGTANVDDGLGDLGLIEIVNFENLPEADEGIILTGETYCLTMDEIQKRFR